MVGVRRSGLAPRLRNGHSRCQVRYNDSQDNEETGGRRNVSQSVSRCIHVLPEPGVWGSYLTAPLARFTFSSLAGPGRIFAGRFESLLLM